MAPGSMALPALKVLIFLPLMAMSFEALLSSASASLACSFLLAAARSLTVISLVSKNLATLVQVVQPAR